ncbi:LysR family transcriptional regulator [Nocardioides sp. LHG3406-4]|uniref:LysR family transcriptional regulator n=1 Tax=Nocardioides sp. LHG3406-4 TaxID=2804575 RepID=UPI003CF70EA6
MLNPIHLQSLRTVVECGSLTRAASRLGYSPSAVSQQMTALERAIGCALFVRTARTIRPTEAGLQLARRSVPLLLELEALVRDLAQNGGQRRRFHIGSSSAMNGSVMPHVIRRCRTELPDVDLVIDDGEPSYLMAQMVGEAALDLALLYRFESAVYVWPRGFVADHLTVDPLDVVLPVDHPAAARPSLALADLADEAWISHTVGVTGSVSFNRACAVAGFVPRVSARSDEYAVILALVAAGQGIAAVPRTAAINVPGVTRRELTDTRLSRSILALRRDSPDNPLLFKVLDIITEELLRLIASTSEVTETP